MKLTIAAVLLVLGLCGCSNNQEADLARAKAGAAKLAGHTSIKNLTPSGDLSTRLLLYNLEVLPEGESPGWQESVKIVRRGASYSMTEWSGMQVGKRYKLVPRAPIDAGDRFYPIGHLSPIPAEE